MIRLSSSQLLHNDYEAGLEKIMFKKIQKSDFFDLNQIFLIRFKKKYSRERDEFPACICANCDEIPRLCRAIS